MNVTPSSVLHPHLLRSIITSRLHQPRTPVHFLLIIDFIADSTSDRSSPSDFVLSCFLHPLHLAQFQENIASPPDMLGASASVTTDTAQPPPLLTTGGSPPGTFEPVSHTFEVDRVLPRTGEAIIIRLPLPLIGPGSVQGSTPNSSDFYTITPTATPRRRRAKYHVAFVVDTSVNIRERIVYLKVWPTPSYSGATSAGFLSSIDYVACLDQHRKDRHIPVPFVHQSGSVIPQTPTSFGPPLVIGGYQDRQPSWVLLELQNVSLQFKTKVSVLHSKRDEHTADRASGNHSHHRYCFRSMKPCN